MDRIREMMRQGHARRLRAFKLRQDGLSNREIAERMGGISEARVSMLVNKYLKLKAGMKDPTKLDYINELYESFGYDVKDYPGGQAD